MAPFPVLPSKALAELGARVARARRARGLSQRDLAKQAGIAPNTLLALERGAPGSSIGNLVLVLDALHLLGELGELLRPERDAVLVQEAARLFDRRG